MTSVKEKDEFNDPMAGAFRVKGFDASVIKGFDAGVIKGRWEGRKKMGW